MSGIFSNIQLATNCTADEIRSIGAEYLNNERQRQDNPLLTWAQLVAQTKAKKKHNAESWIRYVPGLELIDPNLGRAALNNPRWVSSLSSTIPPVAPSAVPPPTPPPPPAAPTPQNVDDYNNNNKLPHQATPAPQAQENNNNNTRFPSLQDFELPEEQSMLKAPPSAQTLRMANHTKTPSRGLGGSVAMSSVSRSAMKPLGISKKLQSCTLEYGDEQSTISSIGSIQTESIEQQKENLMSAYAILEKHNLHEGDVHDMATDREIFLDDINRTWHGGVDLGGENRHSLEYTDDQKRYASRLNDRFNQKKSDRKELVKTIDSEEAKHDESITQSQEKLEETKTEILLLRSEGEKLPTELETQLAALKTTYDQNVRDLKFAADEKDKNINRTLKTAVDLEEKLEEELVSKQKIKREYVGVASKVSHLMSSAHNVVEIFKKASMAPKAQLKSLSEKAQDFAKKHEVGQAEYAEMMKEFE